LDLFLTVVHVATCVFLVAVVLLQHGKGADIGAAFGAGASNTVFGSRGAGNFLTKLTTASVIVFMLTSLTLSYFSGTSRSITGELRDDPAAEAPLSIPDGSGAPAGFETIPSLEPTPEPVAPEAPAPE
jgi:preprotein translocase subunit SecG